MTPKKHSDCVFIVVAKWDPDGRIEVWREGVFDSFVEAKEEWSLFEESVGGAAFLAVLRVDLTGAAIAPFFDASINFQWK